MSCTVVALELCVRHSLWQALCEWFIFRSTCGIVLSLAGMEFVFFLAACAVFWISDCSKADNSPMFWLLQCQGFLCFPLLSPPQGMQAGGEQGGDAAGTTHRCIPKQPCHTLSQVWRAAVRGALVLLLNQPSTQSRLWKWPAFGEGMSAAAINRQNPYGAKAGACFSVVET